MQTLEIPAPTEAPPEPEQAEPLTMDQQYRQQIEAAALGEAVDTALVREILWNRSEEKIDFDRLVSRAAKRRHASQKVERGDAAQEQRAEKREQGRAVQAACKDRKAEILAELETVDKPAHDWENANRQELAKLDARANAANAGRAFLDKTASREPDQHRQELGERHRKLSFRRNDLADALVYTSERSYQAEPGTENCVKTTVKDRAYYAKIGDTQRVRRIDAATAELPAVREELAAIEAELSTLQDPAASRQDWRQFSLEA